jgi:transcriptional regulator with XRE-family HTH domain
MKPKDYRKKHKLTQKQLSELLRISQPHLAMIETDARKPSGALIALMQKISQNEIQLNDFYPE